MARKSWMKLNFHRTCNFSKAEILSLLCHINSSYSSSFILLFAHFPSSYPICLPFARRFRPTFFRWWNHCRCRQQHLRKSIPTASQFCSVRTWLGSYVIERLYMATNNLHFFRWNTWYQSLYAKSIRYLFMTQFSSFVSFVWLVLSVEIHSSTICALSTQYFIGAIVVIIV